MIKMKIPVGPRGNQQTVAVFTNGEHIAVYEGGFKLTLSFDEAEGVARALRDCALVIRATNDVGLCEVA